MQQAAYYQPLNPLPAPALAEVALAHEQFAARLDDAQLLAFTEILANQQAAHQLSCFWFGSQFAHDWCLRCPDWLLTMLADYGTEQSLLNIQYDRTRLVAELAQELEDCGDLDELMRRLRLFRQRVMLLILWRDINRLALSMQTTAALSALADVCIQAAYRYLYAKMQAEFGTPLSEQGEAQDLLVIGMGKLGADELNLSSDIDLIFAFDESGHTDGRRSIPNRDFFTRLGQKLITVLDKQTVDGFVFRVDMRLRPYGDSGALVLNYSAMELYYQQQGRDWERYAMIKGRLVSGSEQQAKPLLSMLHSFTYRRYIDFSAIDALRDLKRQIAREMAKRGMSENIKLGWGGIREIEFVVQSFQLIHGGRDRDLQQASLLANLDHLRAKNMLEADDVHRLKAAYYFLRDVEHLLQAWRDQQTQLLPTDDSGQQRLAWLMGYADWAAFYQALNQHREHVQQAFNAIIASQEEPTDNTWQSVWEGVQNAPDSSADPLQTADLETQELAQAGFAEPEKMQQVLAAWRADRAFTTLPSIGLQRVNRFMPLLLKELAACAEPHHVLARLIPLLRAVLRRSAYLVLLIENPHALKQLVLLVEASSWIAEELAAQPALLDELIDSRNLYLDLPPSKQELAQLLEADLARVPAGDLEMQMETLRYFKRSHSLRAAACEVTNRLPLMKVSDYLTFMAEVVLERVLQLVWDELSAKHGTPRHEDGTLCQPGFVIIGYGKLGGLELGHGSDLDLVFMHAGGSGETLAGAGQRAIENGMFFSRLGQRIIHILSTRTVSGTLYDVDMRLRPSGNSGLLVTNLAAFSRYQEKDAWTWEHQALVRARVVAGCPQLATQFELVRHHVLGRARDKAVLQQEVIEMRRRMREQLDRSSASEFDIKHGAGGIVDLEFLVQYAVLVRGHEYPSLLTWTDNIRILEQLAAHHLLTPQRAEALMEAYRVLRARGHRCVLLGLPQRLPADELVAERTLISEAWQQILGEVPITEQI